MRIVKLILTLSMIVASTTFAATVRPLSLDAIIQKADHVIYGRAIANRSFWDSTTGRIWTETEIQVLDSPKGSAGRTILVAEPGGVLGNLGHLFPGVPKFEENREVVIFLHNPAGNRLRVIGLEQGVYDVGLDPVTGERTVLQRANHDRQIEAAGEAPGLARTPASRRLSDFLSSIREKARIR